MTGHPSLISETKIAVCAYDSPEALSGPSSWFRRVIPQLRRRGFHIRPQIFWWKAPEAGILVNFLQERGIEYDLHQFTTTEQNVRSLLGAIQRYQPEVVVADNVIPALQSIHTLRQWGIRSVGIIRSDDPFYHGVMDRFGTGSRTDGADILVCVSKFLEHEVQRRSEGRCETAVICSGTPIPESTAAWSLDGSFRVAYVGRLVQEQKRILETTDSLIRICKELPNVRGLIVGDGEAFEQVNQRVAVSGADCRLTGRRNPDEVQRLLTECQALLLLSDYEGTPTAVMEAMACGVVPVCLAIRSGIPELVIDGQTGLLVQERGDEVLRAIRRISGNRALWEKLSLGAQRHIMGQYSTDAVAEKWTQLLRRLAATAAPEIREIPRRPHLPKPHPGYAHQDVRKPSAAQRLFQQTVQQHGNLRKSLGRLRRWIRGNDGRTFEG